MNFSPITIPFGDIQPGDWIRFEYNKNQVYNIYQVSQGNNYVELRITPSLSNITDEDSQTINVNHFVIYRVINDGTYVVLDVKKDALNSEGESYTGIIQPEFISIELKGNYDKIITDLTQKNIIS
jgi:hypothetical protein